MNENTNAVPADVSGALFAYRHADAAQAVQRRAEVDAAILAYGDQRARETAEHNAWRDAVLHACAMLEWVPPDDVAPRDVLNRLIAREQEIALDPSVSKAARRLQREAAEQMREQCDAACVAVAHDEQLDADEMNIAWRCACEVAALPLPLARGDDHA